MGAPLPYFIGKREKPLRRWAASEKGAEPDTSRRVVLSHEGLQFRDPGPSGDTGLTRKPIYQNPGG